MKAIYLALALLMISFGSAQATDLPSSKQTGLGLYLTAQEAATFMTQTPGALMVDVRTPEEIDEVGMAEPVDALIPLAIVDRKKGMMFNPDFFEGFKRLAMDRGLTADHPIVLICRSGNRSAQAANALAQMGFTQLYTVTDGFEGDRSASGARDINGWKNAGLPWRRQDATACAASRDGGTC